MAGKDNLVPLTTEKAREIGKKGGVESGKAKKKKKLMSQIYADILAEQTGQKKGLKLKDVVKEILEKGGSPAVTMLKEIREATEGSKIDVSGELNPVKIIINGVPSDKSNE